MAIFEPWTAEPAGPETVFLIHHEFELLAPGYVEYKSGWLKGKGFTSSNVQNRYSVIAADLESLTWMRIGELMMIPRGWVIVSGLLIEVLIHMASRAYGELPDGGAGVKSEAAHAFVQGVVNSLYSGDARQKMMTHLAGVAGSLAFAASLRKEFNFCDSAPPPVAAPWASEPHENCAYFLRRSLPDGVSRGGFRWPHSGFVCPAGHPAKATLIETVVSLEGGPTIDHSTKLFGLRNGAGRFDQGPDRSEWALFREGPFRLEWLQGGSADSDTLADGYSWQVFVADSREVVDLGNDTHCAPRGWVKYHGDFRGALLCMARHFSATGRGYGFVRNALRSYARAFFNWDESQLSTWIAAHAAAIEQEAASAHAR